VFEDYAAAHKEEWKAAPGIAARLRPDLTGGL